MKKGLVLEGGAMRGIYTAGVLDVFLENQISFDGVIGVSAGAIHGASYVSEQPGRSIRYYNKYRSDKRFMSFYSLITTGSLVGEEFCYHEIPEKLDPFDENTFRNSKTDYYVTCTNLETGRPEYIHVRHLTKNIHHLIASASMPFVSRIVDESGRKLLDGGVADSIPLRAFQRRGYEKNVVVLTRPDGYRKKDSRQTLAKLAYRKYPEFVRALRRRPRIYNETLEYIKSEEEAGRILVIRPSTDLHIGRMEKDPEKIQAMYQLGRDDALAQLDRLKSFLED